MALSGTKLPSLIAPLIGEEKETIYCGPYALSVILNKPPEDIIAAVKMLRGNNSPVKSMYLKEVLFFLDFCGMETEAKRIPFELERIGIRTLFETYNSLSHTIREETCLARVGDHFIVIHWGRCICSLTKDFKDYRDKEYVRKQVTNLVVVRKRV